VGARVEVEAQVEVGLEVELAGGVGLGLGLEVEVGGLRMSIGGWSLDVWRMKWAHIIILALVSGAPEAGPRQPAGAVPGLP